MRERVTIPNRVLTPTQTQTQTQRTVQKMVQTLALLLALCNYAPLSAAEQFSGLRVRTITTADQQSVSLSIWYPSAVPARKQTLGPYTQEVSLDAPATSGRFPLILISHGTGGNQMNHHELASALARAGFIAVALAHPGDNYKDRSMVGKPAYFEERPRQVSRVLDTLLADAAWAPLIDPKRIGFLGHSAGGFTGAALIGATPSIAQTVRHCAAHYEQDLWFCRVSGSKEKALENARNADYMPAVAGSADARIRAAVLIAPVGAFFAESSLQSIKVPVRVYVAGQDEILTPRFHADYLARLIPGAQTVKVEAGGHFMMASKLDLKVAIDGAEVNFDPAGFDRASVIAAAARELPLWFAKALAP
jgi:predicted dienelactone hydrolase